MKIIISLILILIAFQTKAQISAEAIQQHIGALSHDSMKGREFGSAHIQKASQYISLYFKSIQVKPYFENYEHTFEVKGIKGNNVLAYIEGKSKKLKNELIIISAHYDHIGMDKPNAENDSVYNGANDNAAGTALVLELAKYFSKQKRSKRSILFVAFTGEEKGLLGSEALAKTLKEKNSAPYLNFNLEMLGTVLTNKPKKVYMTGFNMSNLASLMNTYLADTFVNYSKAEDEQGLFYRSDNASLYETFKIPAHSFSTFDFTNFDYYHHLEDEMQFVDFNNMEAIANQFAKAIQALANSKKKVKLN